MNKLNAWQVNEIQVSFQNKVKDIHNTAVSSSFDAERYLRENWNNPLDVHEEFVILLLSRNNRVKGLYKVSKGGVSSTLVDAKIVFGVALKALASGLILAHNHPSGNLNPGNSDIELTKKLKEAGKLLDISICDHIILAPEEGYYSFADEGLL